MQTAQNLVILKLVWIMWTHAHNLVGTKLTWFTPMLSIYCSLISAKRIILWITVTLNFVHCLTDFWLHKPTTYNSSFGSKIFVGRDNPPGTEGLHHGEFLVYLNVFWLFSIVHLFWNLLRITQLKLRFKVVFQRLVQREVQLLKYINEVVWNDYWDDVILQQ